MPTGNIVENSFGSRTTLPVGGKAYTIYKLATVEAIEQDYDERVHLAVTLADDPGRDLGVARMPGHRFFFSPDEVEPVL